MESACDIFQMEVRLGADFRYKKALTMRVLFEQQHVFDGDLIDGNEGYDPHVERAWVDYKFPNTKLRMRLGGALVGFRSHALGQGRRPRSAHLV